MNRHDVYRFIVAEQTSYPVRLLCRVLGVGHSAFYAWLAGHRWNRKAVARLMRLAGIEGAHRHRRCKPRCRTVSSATAPDLMQRRFTASAPDRLWVADISYLRSWEDSSTWPWPSMRSAGGWSAGRWPITCAPN